MKNIYIHLCFSDNFCDLRISYIPLFDRTERRRQDLMEFYYFHCECSRCHDVEKDHLKSSILCLECKGCVPIGQDYCKKCENSVESSLLEEYENLKSQISSLKTEPCAYTKRALTCHTSSRSSSCDDEMVYENLFRYVPTYIHTQLSMKPGAISVKSFL